MSDSVEELSARIFSSLVAMGDIAQIYIGDRLDFYKSIHEAGAVTSASLAAATGTDERQVREWLEAQAVTGLLQVDDGNDPAARRFSLPGGYETVLADPDSPSSLAWAPRMFTGFFSGMPHILDSFRTGKGIDWSGFSADAVEAQEAQNKSMFLQNVASTWFPSIPDVHARLSQPGARIADIACGAGWSSIAFAEGYEHVVVDGFDLDQYSMDLARKNAEARGVSDRVRFQVADAADVGGSYDLVTMFEALHDMSHPVPVLEAARRLAGEDGTVIVIDEKTEETFAPNGSELERLFYTFSVLSCLPAGLVDGGVGIGAVMRPSDLERLARAAGFADIEILPIESEMFRFYRLLR